MIRAFLNVGYRKGQTIPRVGMGGEVEQWPTYCPKVFILIGDVYDTLRDRSIVIEMRRASPARRFQYDSAKTEGEEIAELSKEISNENMEKIAEQYASLTLAFLTDREEEIWRPLFAVCAVLAPERIRELQRAAIDMSTEKTASSFSHYENKNSEQEAEEIEYSHRLIFHMHDAIGKHRQMFTQDMLTSLLEIDIAPWRKYRGDGLTPRLLAQLAERFGVRARVLRIGKRVGRGYTRKSIDNGIDKHASKM